jgi:hypothetical protein
VHHEAGVDIVRPAAEDRADAETSSGGEDPERRPAAELDPDGAKPTKPERLLERLLPGANPAGAIYGMIAIGALLAAESGLHETYFETIGSAILALSLYWLAHAYADVLGQRLDTRERLTATALGQNLLHDWSIVRGGALPVLVLLICWVAGASQETAVTIDLWATAGSLLAYELLAGLRARARPAELLLEGCVGAAMGLGVLALRVILH